MPVEEMKSQVEKYDEAGEERWSKLTKTSQETNEKCMEQNHQ